MKAGEYNGNWRVHAVDGTVTTATGEAARSQCLECIVSISVGLFSPGFLGRCSEDDVINLGINTRFSDPAYFFGGREHPTAEIVEHFQSLSEDEKDEFIDGVIFGPPLLIFGSVWVKEGGLK